MKPFAIVLPTTFETPLIMPCLESFKWIPYDYQLHLVTSRPWAKAVNQGFKQSGTKDVLLIDDDIEILSNTFNSYFERYLKHADIIGFKLVTKDSRIKSAGLQIFDDHFKPRLMGMPEHCKEADEAAFMSHVTTSCIYIKRKVIDAGILMDENFPGYLYEDVDWTFRAFDAGFKILYIPHTVIHHGTQTKLRQDDFPEGLKANWDYFLGKYPMSIWRKYDYIQPFQLH